LAKNVRLVQVPRDQIIKAVLRYYGSAKGDFAFNCPNCNRPIHASRQMAGKSVKCPSCGRMAAVPRHPPGDMESVDSYLREPPAAMTSARPRSLGAFAEAGEAAGTWRQGLLESKNRAKTQDDEDLALPWLDVTAPIGGRGMWFYTVEEGQQVLMRRPNG